MDIENINELLPLISNETTRTLNIHLATLIKPSLTILQTQNKLEKIYFWGCINGRTITYYIAFGYAFCRLHNCRYFYSCDCLNWNVLPVKEGDCPEIRNCGIREAVCLGSDSDETSLSALVQDISSESSFLPCGAFCLKGNGAVVVNSAFAGLSLDDAKHLSNYQPLNQLKNINYTQAQTCSTEKWPPNWFFAVHANENMVYIKSLQWPGMMSFVRCLTDLYGFVYFGDGRKISNVPLMNNTQ